jgi:chemotaxis protein methyltransferase CheR
MVVDVSAIPAAAGMPDLGSAQAEYISSVAYRLSGIRLPAAKKSFMQVRAGRRLRALGYTCFEDYVQRLQEDPEEQQYLLEALTVHTTAFFREPAHFNWLRDHGLPSLMKKDAGRDRTLTIWSAACSTGAELWTAAIIADGFKQAHAPELDWSVVGTDISKAVLKRAAKAIFTENEIAGLPETLCQRYLLRSRSTNRFGAPVYRITPDLRAHARLAYANLLRLQLRRPINADVAFLRNVLIYFASQDQIRMIENVLDQTHTGGYLILGHSESLCRRFAGLHKVTSSIYRKG